MSAFGPEAFCEAAGVPRETGERFETYRALLERWNRRINLVGPKTLPDFWRRHAWDSVQLLRHAPEGARRWVDFGSGAGFPGLAVATAQPTLEVSVIESNAKKAAFLREAARAVGVDLAVFGRRIEDVTPFEVDVISARAFAPLDRLFDYAAPWWRDRVTGLFLKGRDVEKEIADAKSRWAFDIELSESETDDHGRIACVSRLRAAGES